MRTFMAAKLFFSTAVLSYTLVLHSWGGGIFVYLGEERAPAAVRTLADYSELKPEALSASVERQVLGQAEVEKNEGHIGVHLGNPLIRLDDGTAGFGCKVRGRGGLFERVELTFMGVGISASGETARMVVEAPCEALTEPNTLSTIWIPLGEIVSAAAKDADYFYGDGDAALRIQLFDIPGEWPPSWSLVGVRLLKKDSEAVLAFNSEKIREARASRLSIQW